MMGSTLVNPAMTPAFDAFVLDAFLLEGGRLAATQRPTWEELCLKQAPISVSQGNSQSLARGRFVPTGGTAARYMIPSGSKAYGGTG